MDKPTLTDYAHLIFTLFEQFQQTSPAELTRQNLYTYQDQSLLLFFILMQFRRISGFKTQRR